MSSAGNSFQCECTALKDNRSFQTELAKTKQQAWLTKVEDRNGIMVRVECTPDCGIDPGYYISDNMGDSWVPVPNYAPNILEAVTSYGRHPANANIVYKTITEGEGERKQWFIERSDDAGQTWQRKLALWKGTGISLRWFADIQYHPTDEKGIYAIVPIPGATGKRWLLFFSRDGGDTFMFVLGDVYDLAISVSNPNVLYVVGLFMDCVQKSVDGGERWGLVGQTDEMRKKYLAVDGSQRNNEIFKIDVDPTDPDKVYALSSVGVLFSRDGGNSWCILDVDSGRRYTPCSLFINAEDSRTILIGTTDRGLFRSKDRGCTWEKIDIAKRLRRLTSENAARRSGRSQISPDLQLGVGDRCRGRTTAKARLVKEPSWSKTRDAHRFPGPFEET